MIEDKLTHDERLRLECIAQANLSKGMGDGNPLSILKAAALYEEFIRDGAKPDATAH